MLNAYNIVFAASLILCGRLTDLVGRRRSFVAGVAVFTIASAACGLAPSVEFLILARVVQAFGAAMLVPASLALVIAAFPAERRAHAIGVWGASAAVAAGVGPPIGGALVQLGGWRWAFLVNLPFGLVAVWAARHELVESRAPGRRVMPDLVGAALLVVSLALLNLGIIKGGDWGWTSPEVIGSFVGAAVALVLFVLSSRRHRAPMLDPTLLRLRSFDLGSTATVAAGFGFYAYLLTNVLWLQYVWGYDVLRPASRWCPARSWPRWSRHASGRSPSATATASSSCRERSSGPPPTSGTTSGSGWSRRSGPSGCRARCSAASASVPPCRCSGAPRWRRSRGVATPRHPRWRRAHASSGASSASRSWWSSSATPHRPRWSTSLHEGWVLSIVAFLVVAVLALPLGRIHSALEDEDVADDRPPVVLPPNPPADWALPSSVGSADELDLSVLPLFSTLPDAALHRLERATRVVDLPAGVVLIRQGDPAGSAFAVRTGRLEVLVGDTVVRELGPGQVLGELALLTGEPRSATVRARRDTTVVEIPREALEDVLATDPSAARFVLGQVADRLRTVGAGGAAPPPPERVSVVAVVGLGPAVSAADVAAVGEALRHRLRQHLRVAVPGVVNPDGLARAERDHDRVLLVAASSADRDAAWRDFCLRQAIPWSSSRTAATPCPTRGPPRRRPANPTWCCWGAPRRPPSVRPGSRSPTPGS